MLGFGKKCMAVLCGVLCLSLSVVAEEDVFSEEIMVLDEVISEEYLLVEEIPSYISDGQGTVHVEYLAADYPLVGAEYSLYHVYTMVEMGIYEPLMNYYSLGSIENVDSQSQWTVYQQTIENYINAYAFEPTFSGVTDGEGKVTFSNLDVGLYMLMFDPLIEQDYRFASQGSLIAVTNSQEQTVYPKVTFSPYDDTEEYLVDLQVNKVWRDDEGTDARPEDLNITLFENGAIFDEVILNEGNSWSYRWTDLSGDSTWAVLERVPTGYIATYLQDGRLFTIRNTYTQATQLGGGDGFGVGGGIAVENDTSYHTDVEGALTQTGGTLTQTGALVWPIPYLTAGGMCLILFGILLRRSGDGLE